jgi:hypothetical protein
MARERGTHGEEKEWTQVLVGKPEGKRPLGRWENNSKMDLRKMGWGGMYWIDLAQDKNQWWASALVNTVMNLRLP